MDSDPDLAVGRTMPSDDDDNNESDSHTDAKTHAKEQRIPDCALRVSGS